MITDQPVNNHDDLRKVTDNILRDAGLTIEDSGGKVTFAGKEPVRKTVMKAGAAPACILAANAVAEAAIWKERTGEGQDIHVDLRKAWIEQSPWQVDALPYTLINGASKMFNMGVYVVANPIVPTRDGRWMCMCPIYPSQERKILNLLHCGPDQSQLRQATIKRDALEMEQAAMEMMHRNKGRFMRRRRSSISRRSAKATPYRCRRESGRSPACGYCPWCTRWPGPAARALWRRRAPSA
jgi:crotonobetainyl-CoA:carnitine CoA-transferase CaiB-like acyl-CoA transferase